MSMQLGSLMTLDIDELLPDEDKLDKIAEQVEAIRRTHGKQFPPNYALSWVLANQVVQRYYGRNGLDAIPIWRENFGWSQFNITQAITCQKPADKAEEGQRYIVFDAIAVNWKRQQVEANREAQYDLNNAIWVRHQRPVVAVAEALAYLELDNQAPFDHSACVHGPHAYAYTKLFQVVTDLVCRAPELVGKREVVVDIDHFGNPLEEIVHPLRQIGLVEPGTTREWFSLFHVATNTRLYINLVTGEMVRVLSDESIHTLENPGWNDRNEEQLMAYFAGLLGIPL